MRLFISPDIQQYPEGGRRYPPRAISRDEIMFVLNFVSRENFTVFNVFARRGKHLVSKSCVLRSILVFSIFYYGPLLRVISPRYIAFRLIVGTPKRSRKWSRGTFHKYSRVTRVLTTIVVLSISEFPLFLWKERNVSPGGFGEVNKIYLLILFRRWISFSSR